MKKQFYILVIALLMLACASQVFSQVQTPRYIQMSEATGGFYEYVPQGYPAAGQLYPLLLFVHGYDERGPGTPATLPNVLRNGPPKLINEGNFPTSFTVNNQTFRFIVISPQFTGFPSVNDINNSLDYLIAHYPIDINRIYMTGLSMGGGATWYYPGYNLYFAARLAAIVPVCGAAEPYQTYANNIAAANLPVWATHNNGDPTVPVSNTNTLVSLINSTPVPPNPLAKKTIFNSNSHDAWTVTYNPSYRENGLNVYEWMLQFSRNFTVVPVTGLQLTASRDVNNRINLNWRTETEINNLGFTVQRSGDAVSFSPIAYVPSTSYNGEGADYHYTDATPLAGKNYYRLELKNSDGLKTYSEVRMVNGNGVNDISFYPNPVQALLNIRSSRPLVNALLSISNAKGQLLIQKQINGYSPSPIIVDGLAPGLYFAEIREDKWREQFKFIKQ